MRRVSLHLLVNTIWGWKWVARGERKRRKAEKRGTKRATNIATVAMLAFTFQCRKKEEKERNYKRTLNSHSATCFRFFSQFFPHSMHHSFSFELVSLTKLQAQAKANEKKRFSSLKNNKNFPVIIYSFLFVWYYYCD